MPTKSGLTGKHVALILGSLVILSAAAIIVILLLRKEPVPEPVTSGVPIVNESNLATIGDEINEKVARGMFETYMNTTWTFPNGAAPSSDAIMGNSAANNFAFYFTVTLADTDETVFTSSLIPVGSQFGDIVLDRDLEKGTYQAVVGINMVDDDGAPVENNMGVNVTLVVLN